MTISEAYVEWVGESCSDTNVGTAREETSMTIIPADKLRRLSSSADVPGEVFGALCGVVNERLEKAASQGKKSYRCSFDILIQHAKKQFPEHLRQQDQPWKGVIFPRLVDTLCASGYGAAVETKADRIKTIVLTVTW